MRVLNIKMDQLEPRKVSIYQKLLICTLILCYSSLSIITFDILGKITQQKSDPLRFDTFLLVLIISGLFTLYFYLLKSKQSKISAHLFIFTLLLVGMINSLKWGVDVPIAYLIYTLTIVLAGIIIGSVYSFLVTIIIALFLIILSHLQGIKLLHYDGYWLSSPPSIVDGITATIIFSIISLVSWLSNREIESSLRRAETSEKALLQERDQLEVRVKQRTEELQKAQLEKMLHLYRFADFGRLAAGLIHDIVNPLTVVSLNLEQLHSKASEKLRKADTKALQRAITRATDGTKSIEDYVEAARRQIQQQDIITQFDVGQEIKHVLKIFSYRCRKEKVAIQLMCKSHTTLTGNPIKLSQCLSNLIANALDAHQLTSKKSKYIKIIVSEVEHVCILHIKDNAHGIPHSLLKDIFKPFYTTKDARHGTGIGLAITKDIIVKTFNGSINVSSEEMRWTTFTLKIPNMKKHV